MDQSTVSSIMNVVSELFPQETSIAISDEKNWIYYQPSKQVDLKIEPGKKVAENTVTFKALAEQQRISEYKDSHVFGTPYYGMSIPILEDNEPRGAVTAILPREPLTFPTPFLTVKTTDRWLPIPYDKITFLEAQNRKTHVQSKLGNGTHKFNLSEIEYFLPNDIFVRCHRSYIVNIHHIAEIHPDSHSTFLLIMNDKSKVPVSQSYASYFRKLLCF